jgi:hypothetical protein
VLIEYSSASVVLSNDTLALTCAGCDARARRPAAGAAAYSVAVHESLAQLVTRGRVSVLVRFHRQGRIGKASMKSAGRFCYSLF